MRRSAKEAVILTASILLASVTMSLVVTRCSKSEGDDKKAVKPDVQMLDYLEYAPMEFLTVFKRAYRDIIPKEGYTYFDMPFEDGFVKGEGSEMPCKKHPQVYWKKETKESVCIVTAYFDCQPKYLSHTSECLVL